MKRKPKERDAVSDDVGEAHTNARATSGGELEDGEEPGEEPPDYPFPRPSWRATRSSRKRLRPSDASPRNLSSRDPAVEDELEGVGAYHRVGSGPPQTPRS